MIVLKGQTQGGYKDWAKSSAIENGTGNIEIRNGSLYLQIDHNSIEESNKETYQFKYRSDGFFLIGKEERSYTPVDENHGTESGISSNYLTGEEIRTEKTDGKITARTATKVAPKLMRLEDFTR